LSQHNATEKYFLDCPGESKKHEAGHLGEDFGPETEKAWQRIDAEFLDSMMSDMLKYMRYRF